MLDALLLLCLLVVVCVQWWLLLGMDSSLKEIRRALSALHDEIRIPSSHPPVRTLGKGLHAQAQ